MNIVYTVGAAIDGENYLLIGEKSALEYLSIDDDGIFLNEKSWRSFINGNFTCDYDKNCWRNDVKESTIKKWCYPKEKYLDRFVQKVGKDKFVNVAAEDIELFFDYELYYSRGSDFPTTVEIFVIGEIRD
jgi:hypothetical protein